MSADPLVPEPGNPQALNRYAYVTNNPLRYTDPSGHCPWCVVIGKAILQTVVDVGIDYLIARATGGEFHLAHSLAVNAALNVTTLGVGSTVTKLRHLGRLATLAHHADEAVDAGRAVAQAVRHTDEVERAIRAAREAERPAEEIRRLFQEGLLSAIRPAGEWESLLQGVRQEAGLEVHHLIERRFATQLGLDPGDIPAVVLDRTFHQ